MLYKLTGGAINVGPSPREQRERELIAAVRAPVTGCRRIAIVSRKGGVGKTTTTLFLGHTFAEHRGDRVIALDGNPDAGSLGYRVRRETNKTITHLLVSREEVSRYADIRAFTSQAPTRLEVIAADDDPRITDSLREADYKRVVDLLEVHYNLICMDTGTGVLESASKGILQLADQLVLVTSPSLDSGRAASATLDWLEENGHEDLVAGSVAVINGVRAKGMVDLDKVERHFQARCRAVVRDAVGRGPAGGRRGGARPTCARRRAPPISSSRRRSPRASPSPRPASGRQVTARTARGTSRSGARASAPGPAGRRRPAR